MEDDNNRVGGPPDPQMDGAVSIEGEPPSSKRLKLEAAAAQPSHNYAEPTALPALAQSTTSHPSPAPSPPSMHDVEAALHGIDEADHGLVHNTLAGELIEHEQVEQQHQLQSTDDGDLTYHTDPTDPDQQPDTAIRASPLSASSSLAASPPPPQPYVPPSPPPLGKYQCDNCGALLTYSSLSEIYHCPMCYHTFTLYPPFAPTTSPPLFPLSHTPLPPLVHQALTQWTASDLHLYLHNVPGLSTLAAKAAAAGMDGRYFMGMHVSDMVEEWGLWGAGGVGGSVEGNAALVVQLLNAQRVLRGESVRSVVEEKELVAMLTGMQTVSAAASKPPQPSKSAKKVRDKADRPKKEKERERGKESKEATTVPAEEGAEGESAIAALAAAAEPAPAKPVKPRKQYRIPAVLPAPDNSVQYGAIAATELAALPQLCHPEPAILQFAPTTADASPAQDVAVQPMPALRDGGMVDAIMTVTDVPAAGQVGEGAAAVQWPTPAVDERTVNTAPSPTLTAV